MRILIALTLGLCSLLARAADHEQLYQLAGWPQQRQHFAASLELARQQYRNSLPPAIFQSLDATSQRRFNGPGMDQRALASLRQLLSDPQPALRFFAGPTGQAVVRAEVQASDPAEVRRHPNGLPVIAVSPARQALLDRLARALPAREAGVEMGMALTSLASESLGGLLPGLLGDPQQMLDSQRQQMAQRIQRDLPTSLRYVYRSLSDAQLAEFTRFAESADGNRYYRAAIVALRQALAG